MCVNNMYAHYRLEITSIANEANWNEAYEKTKNMEQVKKFFNSYFGKNLLTIGLYTLVFYILLHIDLLGQAIILGIFLALLQEILQEIKKK